MIDESDKSLFRNTVDKQTPIDKDNYKDRDKDEDADRYDDENKAKDEDKDKNRDDHLQRRAKNKHHDGGDDRQVGFPTRFVYPVPINT